LRTIALPVAVFLAAAAVSETPPSIFVGLVSDSECGLSHQIMKRDHHLGSDLICTRECVDKLHQEFVLADHASGEVYQIDDQKSVRPYAARLVRILGVLDPASGTIHVRKVEPVR
jgi:hypothetical protein